MEYISDVKIFDCILSYYLKKDYPKEYHSGYKISLQTSLRFNISSDHTNSQNPDKICVTTAFHEKENDF